MLKINFGCGQFPTPGWVNVDADPRASSPQNGPASRELTKAIEDQLLFAGQVPAIIQYRLPLDPILVLSGMVGAISLARGRRRLLAQMAQRRRWPGPPS